MEKLEYYFFTYLSNHPFELIEFISGFIPIFALLLFLKKINKYSLILIYYSLLIAVFEISANLFSSFSLNNHKIYLIFYTLETLLLILFYMQNIKENKFKNLFIVILIIIEMAIFANLVLKNNQLDNFSGAIQSIGFIAIALISFYYILAKQEIKNLFYSSFFWINTGNIIYFSGRFFVFLFIEDVENINFSTGLEIYWYIVSILLLIHRIFLAIGISQLKHCTIQLPS